MQGISGNSQAPRNHHCATPLVVDTLEDLARFFDFRKKKVRLIEVTIGSN